MSQGAKFALALVLVMASLVLLFIAFHPTGLQTSSGGPVKNIADLIDALQHTLKLGPKGTGKEV